MVTLIIVINFALALFCLYAAYRLWQIRCALIEITRTVTLWERNIRNTLVFTPDVLTQEQMEIQTLRQHCQQLYLQLQLARQFLGILRLLGSLIWPRFPQQRHDRGWGKFFRDRRR